MKNKICPVCGEGHLHSESELVEFKYKNTKKMLATKYSVCDECDSEIASEDDAKFNKRSVTAFHKTVDGLLTGDELKKIRKILGITQQQASIIFGGGPNSFTKYENGDVIQSAAMDSLIRLSIDSVDSFDILCRKKGIKIESVVSLKPLNIKSNLLEKIPTTTDSSGWFVLYSSSESNQYNEKAEYH